MNKKATSVGEAQARARSIKFASRVFLILTPAHMYVGWSLAFDLPVDTAYQILCSGLLLLSLIIIPCANLAARLLDNRLTADRCAWVSALALGWFSSLLILSIIRDLVLFVPDTEMWIGDSTIVVIAGSLAITLVGLFNARRIAKVVHVTVPIKRLPTALVGFTIAQITDVHVGPTIKANYVRAIVERVNALSADMIALTGDMVDGKVEHLSNDTAPLADLRARYGCYFVTGNHEYYSGVSEWIDEFRRLGLNVLLNGHVVIEHNGSSLIVAGVNDFSATRVDPSNGSDPVVALLNSPENIPKILLAHQPRSAFAAEQSGFDLQLSGHTHGGQFWPWNHFVRIQQPFTSGLNRHGNLWVYTSRGTGYWGPPKRFGAPSEITLIRLEATD
jgi:uncharacterized protein